MTWPVGSVTGWASGNSFARSGRNAPWRSSLLGARELQRVPKAQIERQPRMHLPVVLHETGRRIPLVVVRNQRVAQRGLVVDAEQVLGERRAAASRSSTRCW